MNELTSFNFNDIHSKIFTLRGVQVMLDRDLAELYGVETKVLNQAVKRNLERFPGHFRFQLNENEKLELVTKCDRFETLKYSAINPFGFTERGVSMLSAVLRSETAIQISIRIIDSFVEMRRVFNSHSFIVERLSRIEEKQSLLEFNSNLKFEQLFSAIESKNLQPTQGIFFNSQIFDAYAFIADLIRSAQKSIILIDNYIDESVLTLFSKKEKCVKVDFYTKTISRQLELDLKKFNEQYEPIAIHTFTEAHDRFLIIDGIGFYHIGASLKDLGKKPVVSLSNHGLLFLKWKSRRWG